MIQADHEQFKARLQMLLRQGKITLDEYKNELGQLKKTPIHDATKQNRPPLPDLTEQTKTEPPTTAIPSSQVYLNQSLSGIHPPPETSASHLSFDELPLELPQLKKETIHRYPTAPMVPPIDGIDGIHCHPSTVILPPTEASQIHMSASHLSTGKDFQTRATTSSSIFQTRYRLENILSQKRGELDATSYLAHDLLLGEHCVIHIASQSTIKTTGNRNRFLSQYHQQRKLTHPQLAQVHHLAYLPNEHVLFVLMEYIPGKTLTQYIEKQSAKKALPFTTQNVGIFLSHITSLLRELKQQSKRPVKLCAHDIVWSPKNPTQSPKILRMRWYHEHEEGKTQQPVSEAEEVCALGFLLRQMLMGNQTDMTECSPSQVNPTVPPVIDEILAKATHPNHESRYSDIFAMFEDYQQAIQPPRTPSQEFARQLSVTTPLQTPIPHFLTASQNFQAHMSGIIAISSDQNGQILLTAGQDHQLKWWDTKTWSAIYSVTIEDASLNCATLSPCGRLIAFCKSSHRVEIRYAGDASTLCLLHHAAPVQKICWGNLASHLFISTSGSDIHLWDIPSGTPISTWHRKKGSIARDLQMSPDGSLLASLHEQQTIQFWSIETKQWLFDLPKTSSPAKTMAFLPNQKNNSGRSIIFTGHKNGKLFIWDYQTGLQESKVQAHRNGIICLKLSPDGKWLLTSDSQGESTLWPLDAQVKLGSPFRLKREGRPITSGHFFCKQPFLVTCSKGPQLELWNAPEEMDTIEI